MKQILQIYADFKTEDRRRKTEDGSVQVTIVR